MTDTGHRKPRRLRLPRFRWRWPRPGTIAHVSDDGERGRYPVDHRSIATTLTTIPIILTADHPWQLAGCLICHANPGADPIRYVAIFDTRLPRANSWHLGCRGYFIHADHLPIPDEDMVRLAHITEFPGCACNSMSPIINQQCVNTASTNGYPQ